MSNQQHDNGPAILLAFLAGAALGTAAALLWAPAAGSDTREAVGRRARESRDRVLEALQQGRGILNERRESVTAAFERARTQKPDGLSVPEHDA